MPLILPGNVASATAPTGYDVTNSVRLDSDGHFTRTWNDSGGGATWTLSLWFKRGKIDGVNQTFLSGKHSSLAKSVTIRINSDDKIQYLGNYYGANRCNLITSAVFRDPSAWTHLVVGQDSTESTEGDRLKFWINGSRVTAFDTETYYAQNQNDHFNEASTEHQIGAFDDGDEFQGYFAQFCFLHGVQYDADQFGEFDSSSPTVWKPIDISEIATDDSGFFLDFADSDNLGDDESGNTDGANDWTSVNIDATDQATDSPSNNFATFNPLIPYDTEGISMGGCKFYATSTASSPQESAPATMGFNSGKWYAEFESDVIGGSDPWVGFCPYNVTAATFWGILSGSHPMSDHGLGQRRNGVLAGLASGSDESRAWSLGEIVMLALDMDNGKLYIGKEGTWFNSGDPANGSNEIASFTVASYPDMTFGVGGYNGMVWLANFGGCSAFTVSSANQDANGYGNFEFAVPRGFYAACTKNLAEFG